MEWVPWRKLKDGRSQVGSGWREHWLFYYHTIGKGLLVSLTHQIIPTLNITWLQNCPEFDGFIEQIYVEHFFFPSKSLAFSHIFFKLRFLVSEQAFADADTYFMTLCRLVCWQHYSWHVSKSKEGSVRVGSWQIRLSQDPQIRMQNNWVTQTACIE